MILWLTTAGLSFVSALAPFLPIEVYILGAGAATTKDTSTAVSLGLAAGVGATAGKVVWYELARRSMEAGWVRRKLEKPKMRAAFERWTARVEGRPIFGGAVMFVAASLGIPPLLVLAFVAGALRMPMWVFLPTVLVGRTIRFTLLFMGVDLAVH